MIKFMNPTGEYIIKVIQKKVTFAYLIKVSVNLIPRENNSGNVYPLWFSGYEVIRCFLGRRTAILRRYGLIYYIFKTYLKVSIRTPD